MARAYGNLLSVGARSAAFHLLSGLVTGGFLLLLPLMLAPVRIGWPVLRGYILTQLWLLRVVCKQGYALEDFDALPAGPVILAARHEALWETLVLPVLLDNPAVFLKQEILRYPIAGAIARKLGHIAVDRSGNVDRMREMFAAARAQAATGRSFLIFPNGTRNPEHRLRVQKGVAVLYRALEIPCVPVVVNSGALWPYKSWLRLPGTITVRALPPLAPGLETPEFMQHLAGALARPA